MCFSSSGMGGSSREPRLVVPFRNFEEEMKHPGVWEAEKRSTSTADVSQQNLSSLYRPLFSLICTMRNLLAGLLEYKTNGS